MYAAKIITPSKRNIKESNTVFLLLFSGSVSWKAYEKEKTHKNEYIDKYPLHKLAFISRSLSAYFNFF